MLAMAVARSSSGSVAIRYVIPVLWMTSCLHRNMRREKRKLKVTQHVSAGFDTAPNAQIDPLGEARDPGRSLISTIVTKWSYCGRRPVRRSRAVQQVPDHVTAASVLGIRLRRAAWLTCVIVFLTTT